MTTYVLVHGGSVTGAVWDFIVPLLSKDGDTVHAPTLADERTTTLTEHINQVSSLGLHRRVRTRDSHRSQSWRDGDHRGCCTVPGNDSKADISMQQFLILVNPSSHSLSHQGLTLHQSIDLTPTCHISRHSSIIQE